MPESSAILISLKARHATGILSGVKTVEFRRRRPRIEDQTLAWIYAKRPVAAVVGIVTVTEIVTRSPTTIWRRFGSRGGISRGEFLEYFEGCEQAHALLLEEPAALTSEITLRTLRQLHSGFQPPQFFVRLTNNGLHSALQDRQRGA